MNSEDELNKVYLTKGGKNRKFLVRNLQHFISIRLFTCVFFTFALVLLGAILATVTTLYGKANVDSLFFNDQKTLMLYISKFTTHWLEQGKSLIEREMDFFRYQDSRGHFVQFRDAPEGNQYEPFIKDFMVYASSLIRTSTKVSYLGFQMANGRSIICGGSICFNRNNTSEYNVTEVGLQGAIYATWYDKNFNPTTYLMFTNGDARKDPSKAWWREGIVNEDYHWTNFRTYGNTQVSMVTKKWYDFNGDFQILAATWFSIPTFNEFLSQELSLENGEVFFIDLSDSSLLSSSSGANHFTEDAGTFFKVKPHESENDVIKSAALFIQQMNGNDYMNVSGTGNVPLYFVDINGNPRLISLKNFDVSNLKMLGVYVADYNKLFRSIWIGNILSWSIYAVMVIIFVSFATFASYIMMRPFSVLAKEMLKIEKMDLENIHFGMSWFIEVRKLQEKFKYMIRKLIEYRSFLPSLLYNIDTSEETNEIEKEKHQMEVDKAKKNNVKKEEDDAYNSSDDRSNCSHGSDSALNRLQCGLKRKDFSVVSIVFKGRISLKWLTLAINSLKNFQMWWILLTEKAEEEI